MRIVSLPREARGLVFDLDNTLYTHSPYAAFQESVLVERLAKELGEEVEATRTRIEGLRAERLAAGLGKTSLGNLFASLGFDIETSVRWREEHIEPRDWLRPDPRLDEALAALATSYALALLTNNPRSVGEKSLEALGVGSRFGAVVGLDDTMISKPASEPFARAALALGIGPELCISIGDRYDVDIAPALELGMGGILVDGVEDVYALPRLLAKAAAKPA